MMMDHSVLNNLLLPVLLSAAWGTLLVVTTKLLDKYINKLTAWSRFWQLAFVIALVPLLPGYSIFSDTTNLSHLSHSFEAPTEGLLQDSLPSLVEVSSSLEVLSILSISVLIISIVGLYFISMFIRDYHQVVTLIKQASPVRDLSVISPEQRQKLQRMKVDLRVTSAAISPFVFGVIKSYLVLPDYFFKLSGDKQFLLLEHELNHLERKDPQTLCLMRLFTCIFWFNPFLRLAEKRFIHTMELDCDQDVLVQHPAQKFQYAQTLIESLKYCEPSGHLALASHFADKSQKKQFFEQRIRQAMAVGAGKTRLTRRRWIVCLLPVMIIPLVVVAKPLLTIQVVSVSDESWSVPVQPVTGARLTSDFGQVDTFRGKKAHKGMDFAAPTGTPIRASLSGKVVVADNTSLHKNYGKVIVIEHANGMRTLYSHLDSFNVSAGDYVPSGQVIGKVGTSGRVTGAHLHFEVIKNGERIDPKLVLNY